MPTKITDQTGSELAEGDSVVMCFGNGLVNGFIQAIDHASGAMLVSIPIPIDPTKLLMNIAKVAKQPLNNKTGRSEA